MLQLLQLQRPLLLLLLLVLTLRLLLLPWLLQSLPSQLLLLVLPRLLALPPLDVNDQSRARSPSLGTTSAQQAPKACLCPQLDVDDQRRARKPFLGATSAQQAPKHVCARSMFVPAARPTPKHFLIIVIGGGSSNGSREPGSRGVSFLFPLCSAESALSWLAAAEVWRLVSVSSVSACFSALSASLAAPALGWDPEGGSSLCKVLGMSLWPDRGGGLRGVKDPGSLETVSALLTCPIGPVRLPPAQRL